MTNIITTLREIFPGYCEEIDRKLPEDVELQAIVDDLLDCHYVIISNDFDSKSGVLKEHYKGLYEDLRSEVLQHIIKTN